MEQRFITEHQTSPEISVPISPEEIRRALDRILNSRHFSQAPKKRKFVQLICDYHLAGRAKEINEHLIGLEVYERNDRYSPAEDPVVRVAADLYFAHDAVTAARALLAEHCRAQGEISAAVFRDRIGASRKFVIALLDWFDRSGVTTRVGDMRRLRR